MRLTSPPRYLLPLLFAASLLLGASAARAGDVPGRIVFPVVGVSSYSDDFGDPRGQGRHEGNDILAPRRAPAVAAEDGVVRLYHGSRRAGCMLYLEGESGTTYLYVHLNNDLTQANDNRGGCRPGVSYARDLSDGSPVRAGQLVGYVGDSGDADGVHPHLHFELHPDAGTAVSPYRWLKRARVLLFALPESRSGTVLLTLTGTVRSLTNGLLGLKLDRVRLSTGWRSELERRVSVTVTDTTGLGRGTAGSHGTVVGESIAPGTRVTVQTAPFTPSFLMQLAPPGTLTATQILIR